MSFSLVTFNFLVVLPRRILPCYFEASSDWAVFFSDLMRIISMLPLCNISIGIYVCKVPLSVSLIHN